MLSLFYILQIRLIPLRISHGQIAASNCLRASTYIGKVHTLLSKEDEIIRGFFWILAIALCTTALAVDLTGSWKADTKTNVNIYIRQSNESVWLLCEEAGENPSWISVAYGTVEDDKVMLRWADVPKANMTEIGTLEFEIVSDDKLHVKDLQVINQTGGWGEKGHEIGTEILRVKGGF
jgi:hypothetical protein